MNKRNETDAVPFVCVCAGATEHILPVLKA